MKQDKKIVESILNDKNKVVDFPNISNSKYPQGYVNIRDSTGRGLRYDAATKELIGFLEP